MSATRRQFFATAASAAAPAFLAGQAKDRPLNVLSIVCDQMRGDCMGFLGHPNVRTPNIDRLASEGTTFERAFVNNPVCLPSRKSCFSGRYPHEHGSLTNRSKGLLPWDGSMLGHFAKAGYRTGWCGKNHTYSKEALENLDFQSIRDREPFRAYNGTVPPHWHTDVYWPEEDCHPEINTRAALEFLDASKGGGDPFFLHVSYFDPHPPYMAPAEFTSRYSARDMKMPASAKAADLSERFEQYRHAFGMDRVPEIEIRETMRYYYAQIEWGVDKQVGRLLRALGERGLAENTVVVFTSDHGDFMGSHGMVRKGMFLYDALLHVPMIWRVPGGAKGARTKAFAQHIDLFPTLADLARTPAAPKDLPGRSLRPFLEGGNDDPSHAIFTSAGYGELSEAELNLPLNPKDLKAEPRHSIVMDQNMNPQHRTAMARTAEWKLVMTETRGPELYRLNGGVTESRNMADDSAHADVRRKLESKLTNWWKW
jgi:choline-sulfatase